ncbi:extracellular matrix regulator RemB [Sporolactobacillus putidus]|uniref:DUF370 domain-containing protein n=1 Tax=Sporolactobacillus putidus TaxID=492735 RepID=A0A917W3E8_9BACL|nr:extracellular matrix/biofilm biosynthesis regulator RemA family protein [Sporolactobacillus putidus]GGL57934.1 hypothetical protein GCM10007968_22380 [Sporolactobacillus putidus]
MYVHLGEGMIVDSSEVIAVFDYQTIKDAEANQAVFASQKKNGAWVQNADQPIKSVILTEKRWYVSSFSSATIRKRAGSAFSLMKDPK